MAGGGETRNTMYLRHQRLWYNEECRTLLDEFYDTSS
jgi:hypothetical protein